MLEEDREGQQEGHDRKLPGKDRLARDRGRLLLYRGIFEIDPVRAEYDPVILLQRLLPPRYTVHENGGVRRQVGLSVVIIDAEPGFRV